MDTGLAILLGFAPPGTLTASASTTTSSYALIMLVIFGISFELPLLMVFLNVIGVLPQRLVAKHRRMVIFIMFVFAALATAGRRPVHDDGAGRSRWWCCSPWRRGSCTSARGGCPKGEDFSHLADDEASPLRVTSEQSDRGRDAASMISSPIDSGTTDPDPRQIGDKFRSVPGEIASSSTPRPWRPLTARLHLGGHRLRDDDEAETAITTVVRHSGAALPPLVASALTVEGGPPSCAFEKSAPKA